uniref:Uncharacterized protein n=1 Tax=Arundo donax TaxID=35708 RepID=A0A0A9GIF0_ARUDO
MVLPTCMFFLYLRITLLNDISLNCGGHIILSSMRASVFSG